MEMKECLKCGYQNQSYVYDSAAKCPKCGAYYAKVEAQAKRQAEEQAAAEKKAAEKSAREFEKRHPKTRVETYKGKQSKAVKRFQHQAAFLEADGYHAVSELWEPGRWSAFQILVCLTFAVLFLLIPFIGWMITLFLVLYILIARPPGTLTVTYKRGDAGSSAD